MAVLIPDLGWVQASTASHPVQAKQGHGWQVQHWVAKQHARQGWVAMERGEAVLMGVPVNNLQRQRVSAVYVPKGGGPWMAEMPVILLESVIRVEI